jgi:hypothetical protein
VPEHKTSRSFVTRRRFPWLLALLVAPCCWAHDSWLRGSPALPGDGSLLQLGTGVRYPVMDVGVTPGNVAQARCTDGAGATALQPGTPGPKALSLQVQPAAAPALACWIELGALDIELEPKLVQVYLAEIRPPDAVRARWSELQAGGLRWKETYRKFARIELPAAAGADAQRRAQARRPVGQPLEIVVLGDKPLAVQVPTDFQVLRDGVPLAGFAVEFISERSPLGLWRRTDAEGRVSLALPYGGGWLVRGTELLPPEDAAGRWQSRFVTLTLELGR